MFLIRWLWKNLEGYRAMYIVTIFLALINQSMFVINPFLRQQIIDTFIDNENAAKNLTEQRDLLIWLLAAILGFSLVRVSLFYIYTLMFEHSSQGLLYRVRKHLYDNMQSEDSSFYELYRTGDIMTRLSGDLEMVRHSVAWVIKRLIENIIIFSSVTIYFFILDPLMALCLLSLTPVIFGISLLFRKKIKPMYINLRERLSQLNTAGEENISGHRVIKAFAREDFEIERFGEKNEEYKEANQKAALMWMKFFPFLESSYGALMAIQILIGGAFTISGRLSLGELSVFLSLIWAMSFPIQQLGMLINDLQRFTASANKIIEVYYNRPKIATRTDAVSIDGRIKGKIEFKNVSFKYGKEYALSDINFTIEAGQTVAVMGETGSGKTTLASLIPRIHDATKGEIEVDGINVRMLKLEELRSGIGMATQEVLLYSDTAEGCIAFGNIEMPFEEVVNYAEKADAHGFITAMYEGYDTIIGERGVGISGGQKQRIALARALAIKPAILILDDTTSAVDLETERHIQESLANLDFSCTKIIIAQRISSVKNADKIIVLKNGRISEMGTHAELVQNDGYYKEIYDLQT
ncbi:MAG: ABC transporter ATP-binding protein/permease [Oscillospiraceae bacterium]|jgi:ATP-binding cassette subfamily B protein|nr:ABC transporter ATP-binding protein/permease [Oscillospiraceae bacterium]